MKDLFTPLTRDERQEESVRKWLKAKGKGTIIAATGYGKTKVAIDCFKRVLTKYPHIKALIVVPTDTLKDQWTSILDSQGLSLNSEVQVINTTAKYGGICDLLILDEAHRVPAETFSQVFDKVKYKLILALTATLERLDGKHILIEKHCPVIDEITLEVAKLNGWVSDFTEYQVIITADDIDNYRNYNENDNVLCHDDLHEENILIDKNGLSGIIDFGCVKIRKFDTEFSHLFEYDVELNLMIIKEYEKLTGRKVDINYALAVNKIRVYGSLLWFFETNNKKYIEMFKKYALSIRS